MSAPRRILVLLAAAAMLLAADNHQAAATLIEVNRIWDRAAHNAFTDLVRFHERWYCAFREGSAHVSPDGALRILSSADGARWVPTALLTLATGDLRDPKLCVTPDQRLMLTSAAAMQPGSKARHHSFAWHSSDGREWSDAVAIGDPDVWLWRVSWHRGKAYSMGYSTSPGDQFLRIYMSTDPTGFQTLGARIHDRGYPNETAILFQGADDSALCLLRRDGAEKTAQLGRSRPPYRAWSWEDLGVRIGGPQMIRLPDGRIVAAVRLYDGAPRTSLCWLDPAAPALKEFLRLPSGGDTSYAGLVYHEELLWVSYYSSHEGKSGIYLAKVRLPPAPPVRR